jgi:predicted permease
MQELRFVLRQLVKSPGFTIAAVITLALGIGANVAVFSVMNAVLLNPTGIPHPDGLVALRAKYMAMADLQNISVSAPDFEDSLESRKIFQSAAAMQPGSFNYTAENARPERLVGARVTSEWFDVFQTRPVLGRAFRPEDDVPGANNVIVLSNKTWQTRFGGDQNIIGRKLDLNGQMFEVVGVMSADFNWPNEAQLWTPLAQPPERYHDENYRFNENLFAVARLQPGTTLAQANGFENSLSQAVKAKVGFAQNAGWGMFAVPLREFISGDLRKPLSILLAAVLLVLMIACANIAGLQLARATDHQHENSVRMALGASRARLMVQPLLQSLLLAIVGLGVGILFAVFVTPSLLYLAPVAIARNIDVHLSQWILLFASAVTVIAVLLCGSAPALYVAGSQFISSLREGGRSGTSSRSSNRMRSALVIAEITVAVFLLVCSGLLFESLETVERLSTGFDPQGVITATVALPRTNYDKPEKQVAFWQAAEQNLKNIPGVTAVGLVSDLPFGGNQGSASFSIKGQVLAPNNPGPHGHISLISPDYFQTMGIPVVRGRAFTDSDRMNTQQVAMIDETLARQYWPDKDVLNQYLSIDNGKTWLPIVGVVKHIKISALDAEANEGFYFLPVAQQANDAMSLVLKSRNSHPESLKTSMEAAIAAVDPRQAVFDVKTMEERVQDSLGSRRFVVVLLGIFAGLSLFLSALGLYAVITYLVRMRVREIGIRMAVGAQRGQIATMVLRHGVNLALGGCVLGLIVTFSAGQALRSMLYGVSLYNPVTALGACVVLAALVLLASYLPARRAMSIDPVEALRED